MSAFDDPPFDHVWYWRETLRPIIDPDALARLFPDATVRLPSRKGQRCRVRARGAKNGALVEFEDGYRTLTSRYAVRKVGPSDAAATVRPCAPSLFSPS